VLVWGGNGNDAWRGLVTVIELIYPRPYIFQPAFNGRLIYTVIHMSARLLTQANPELHLRPPHELRRTWRAISAWPYPRLVEGGRAFACAENTVVESLGEGCGRRRKLGPGR
jgi:hypothetical protein